MSVPDHVWEHWKHTGLSKVEVLELHARGLVSFLTLEEALEEVSALIEELEQTV